MRPQFLRRLVPILCAVWLAPLAVSANEPTQEFLDRLRDRGYFDVAAAYLQDLADNPTVDAKTKQRVPYQLAQVYLQQSRTEKDPTRRLKLLDQAAAEFEKFLKAQPKHELAGLAQLQMGNALVEKGRMLADQAGKDENAADKAKLLADARGALGVADTTFQAVVKRSQDQVNRFPKVLDRTQTKLREQRDRARRALIEAKFYLANTAFELGKTFERGSEEHKRQFTEAAKSYHKIYVDYRRWLAGLYAAQAEGRCYQELGDLRRALGLYMELLDQPDVGGQVFRDLKTKTLGYAMAAWNDPREKKYEESIKRGEAWILRPHTREAWVLQAHTNEVTAPEGLAIVYRIAQAKHAVIQRDLQAAKDDPNMRIDEERHRRLKLDVILHTSLVAELKGEYQEAAKKLLAKYQDAKKPR